MKESEIIKSIIDIVITYTGTDNMSELDYLFERRNRAMLIERDDKGDDK